MSAKEWRDQFSEDVDKNLFGKINIQTGKVGNKINIPKIGFPTEHEIQSAILERLGLLPKAFFWRENSGLVNVESNGKKRMFRAGIKGIPDIMGVYNGVPVGIEVKRSGKKQSLEQKAFQQRFDQCGGVYIICTDAAQVVNQIMTAVSMRNAE